LECLGQVGTFSYMTIHTTSQGVVRVVALETSGRTGSLATVCFAASQVEVVSRLPLPDDRRTAQSLLPALTELLETSRWQAGELDLICTTTGPGSFTGLRIGVTTAKTLAYATGAKLVGVNTLAAIAAGVNAAEERVWAIIDAQRQELFAACFQPGWQNEDAGLPEILVIGVDDWLGRLRAGDVVSGPPLKKLSDRLPADVRVADASLWSPKAETVARLGIASLERGEVIDPMQLVPHYYRKSAAEEKADAKR
jgi:tRNA threonylcarbamoyladenosine biosynthesis protein TsaB